ncbi:nitrous oxide reductase accessory protein NosL [Stagnihabitans tardus]|uniref:Copper resistance protein CopZ n=1 Tax=Stagnihabitans tardus TaxID=2699202 RepID=A0AAE4YG81_9RHOB|nr:nitrous oxide reductase accessory protein NosL [Stagnihabitans tardus]NBZ89130.1 copper resistance protein CopZ [Stagnihabitans tardus]
MKRLALALLLLAACREEVPIPDPIAMTPDSIGFFCQMNIMDHGGPKAQVHLDTFPGQPLFFSQVRDALAYLRMPERDGVILATYVTDMGAADWDDPAHAPWVLAAKATYVVGSRRLGGMDQPEFIPFADPARAQAFAAEFGGKVLTLAELPIETEEAEAPEDPSDFAARLKSATEGN